ncbi:MAG: ABC transporter permease [Bacilli bacterium]|nr:ABC transporter permease [Bacilli bacterium]
MKNRIFTNSLRQVKKSYKRFVSLLLMSLLGVGFFVGIQLTSPDMLKTLDNYLDETTYYDLEIISNYGLTQNDLEALRNVDQDLNIVGSKSLDSVISVDTYQYVVKLIELTTVNKVTVIDGNLPTNSQEIVVEEKFLSDNDLAIGDFITIDSDNLLSHDYKITGIIESPLYFSSDRGTSQLGNGSISYYMYVLDSAFNMDYFTSIYVNSKSAQELITSEQKYTDLVKEIKNKIEVIKDDRQRIRLDDIKKLELKKTLGIEPDNIDAYEQYFSDLDDCTWYIYTRENSSAYQEYIDATTSLKKLGNVFPIVFYVIAILISLISMTRMVEEDRTEIGTLKALGFANVKILFKYISYAALATIIGGFIGVIIGGYLIPSVIWNIYLMLFKIPNFIISFDFKIVLVGTLIAFVCIVGATFIAVYKTLLNMPSILIRPKAPVSGKRILLERMPILWKHLKFSNKISTRNLFRYKKRIIMTVVGIAGCTALILAGFGLRDSIVDIVDLQFSNVQLYDDMVIMTSSKDKDALLEKLNNDRYVKKVTLASMGNVSIKNNNIEKNTTMVATDNEFKDVINMNDINNNITLEVSDDVVYISSKLAKLIDAKVGEDIEIIYDKKSYFIEVGAIVENYVNNYIYINKNTYLKLFKNYNENIIYISLKDDVLSEYNEKLTSELLKFSSVASVLSVEETVSSVSQMFSSLDSVVVILIVSSALLAFVVLYNLSTINISERKREIATLKVLGFYDSEVDSYITKENIILTVIGLAIGLFLGSYLSHFIISTCETENLLFVRQVNFMSYVYSSIITVSFTIIVNIVTHFSLKKIDMIESLKGVE